MCMEGAIENRNADHYRNARPITHTRAHFFFGQVIHFPLSSLLYSCVDYFKGTPYLTDLNRFHPVFQRVEKVLPSADECEDLD